MSIQGIIIIDLLAIALILTILQLVRTGRLYAGYAALWTSSTACLIFLVSFPPLLDLVTRTLGAVFPVSALTLLAFCFNFLVLVLFSVKLTVLTERQTQLIQALALRELTLKEAEQAAQTAERAATAGPEFG